MWLSNAPGVCSLACWAPGSDETPIGFNIGAGASIGGSQADAILLLSNKGILRKERYVPHLG